MDNLRELSEQIASAVANADQAMESGAFNKCGAILSDAENALREEIQRQTMAEMQQVRRKLQRGEPLAPKEKGLLRLWIVGDAEWYVKKEHDFKDWRQELKRIAQEVSAKREAALTPATAASLRALLHDAARVTADICHYLEYRERMAMFEDSTKEIDSEERRVLLEIIDTKSASELF